MPKESSRTKFKPPRRETGYYETDSRPLSPASFGSDQSDRQLEVKNNLYKLYKPSLNPGDVKISVPHFKPNYDHTLVKAHRRAKLETFTKQEFIDATDTSDLTLVRPKIKKPRRKDKENSPRFQDRPYTPTIPTPGRDPYAR